MEVGIIRLSGRDMEERRQRILQCALECFCNSSIEGTTLAEIAKAAQVGEATIYRYFTNKTELVIQTGQLIWKAASQHFTDSFDNETHIKKTGIEQMQSLLQNFITLYDEYSEIFKFIYNFDNYVIKQSFTDDQHKKYKKSVHSLKYFFHQAVEKGMKDGSIRICGSWEEIYWTLANILTTLSQKLLLYGNLLSPGGEVTPRRQLELACDIIINGMRVDTPTDS